MINVHISILQLNERLYSSFAFQSLQIGINDEIETEWLSLTRAKIVGAECRFDRTFFMIYNIFNKTVGR